MTVPASGLRDFFLLDPPLAGGLLDSRHDPVLVALSVAVAMLTSALALQLAGAARDTPQRLLRRGALACGAVALGAGVWAMHFIGMLAFQVCTTVASPPLATAASRLPSLAAAGIAMGVLARPRLDGRQLLTGGVLTGAGIGVMHYSGMAALDTGAALRYDPAWFALSIVVAVALAVAALWLRFGLVRHRRLAPLRATLAGGAVLGLAISGMHYTAMAATRFVGSGGTAVPLPARPLALALAVAGTTALVCLLAVGVNAALRYWQMIRELGRSQARLRATVATAGDGIVSLDGSGQLLSLNRAAEQILGCTSAQSLGRHLAALLPGLTELKAGERLLQLEPEGRPPQVLRISMAEALDGEDGLWVAFISDITAVRERNAEFEGVVQAVYRGLMVIEFALDGTILQASEPFLQLTGYRADELVGHHHARLCLPEEVSSIAYAEHWAALRRGEHRTGDFERLGRQGRRLWIRATYNPILGADGRPLRIMKFVSDLTERHALEQDLRLAKERAEQGAQAKSSFLANMSHEIRTPMNAIIGFTEVVLEGPLTAAARAHLQTIHRSARSLLGLINDILDAAKLDHDAVELEQRPFSLGQLAGDVMATLRLGAEAKGLQLTLDGGEGLHDVWLGDSLRLQQVLLNLVGNAIKFTDRGSVRLEIRAAAGATGLAFAVVDTGIGIPADRIARIFDPFAQADASMTRRYGGTGLGTTIARQLVTLMGGEIGVDSAPGRGSRFWFTLPLQPGERLTDEAGPDRPPAVALPPLRILVADDVAENLELLRLRLGALGHEVHTAGDGRAALERLQAEDFDVALMDVQMPQLDGLSATRQWRAWEREHAAARRRVPLPVIALTAGVREADRQETLAAGMSGFATKPVDLPLLLAEIARVTGLGAPASAGQGSVRNRVALPDTSAAAVPGLPPGRDWSDGLRRWGDADLLREQLLRFLRQSLAELPPAGPWPPAQAAALAHRYAGAAGNLGLAEIAAMARHLESAGESAAAPAWPALRAELQRLADELQVFEIDAHGAGARPAEPPRRPLDWALLRGQLQAGEFDEALLQQALATLPDERRRQAREALDCFDFDAALKSLTPEEVTPA